MQRSIKKITNDNGLPDINAFNSLLKTTSNIAMLRPTNLLVCNALFMCKSNTYNMLNF